MGLSQLLLSFSTRVLIRYDREFNVDSKAECDQLNLAHETKTNRQCPLISVQVQDP